MGKYINFMNAAGRLVREPTRENVRPLLRSIRALPKDANYTETLVNQLLDVAAAVYLDKTPDMTMLASFQ